MYPTREADQTPVRRPAVCIVRHNYYPDTHVRRDAEALVGAGYDVSVVGLRRPGQPWREVLNGVRVYRLPVRHRRGSALRYAWEYGAFTLLAILTVGLLHLQKRFACIEIDNMPDTLIAAGLFPKLTGAKLIFYIFDNMPELLAHLRGWPLTHPLIRVLARLERTAAGAADRVVVPHRRAMELVAGRGIPDRKLTVVLNTADERIFRPRLAAPANKEAGKFLVVTHGAVLERYGIQVLIAALPRVIAEVPNVEVQVFGEGEYRPTLEAQARRLGVDGYVKFRGFVPMDDLVATLSRADAGYVGMLNDLTLPNKLMEYVALGVPVLLARWTAFESYFPADAVYYFGPGNGDELAAAILAIFQEPNEARRRVRRAWQLYRTYGWERQQRIYLGVYAELLSLEQTQGLIGENRSPGRALSLPDWPGPRL